jgi:hypothetical protein
MTTEKSISLLTREFRLLVNVGRLIVNVDRSEKRSVVFFDSNFKKTNELFLYEIAKILIIKNNNNNLYIP